MLIEQIIGFESRVPGRYIFIKLVIFMTKQKSSKANLWVHYLILKMLQKAMYFDFLDFAKSQNLTTKCKILKVFWTWPEERDFFNWLSNIKNFVLSNGSENVRNVIRIALNSHFFPKNRPATGGSAPMPPLWHVWVALICSPRFPILI